MNQETTEDDIINLINKIIVVTSESENLTKSLLYVIDLMTDDTPDNDLHQDSLESLIFTSKQKINNFKIRYNDSESKLRSLFTKVEADQNYKGMTEEVLNKCLNSISENESNVKALASTAMKWEVGASEVIKGIKESIDKCKTDVKKVSTEMNNLKGNLLELIDTFGGQMEEYGGRLDHLDDVTTNLTESTTPLKMFIDFKNSLINVLEKENNNKQVKLVRFSEV